MVNIPVGDVLLKFEPTVELAKEVLAELVKARGIVKCKQ